MRLDPDIFWRLSLYEWFVLSGIRMKTSEEEILSRTQLNDLIKYDTD